MLKQSEISRLIKWPLLMQEKNYVENGGETLAVVRQAKHQQVNLNLRLRFLRTLGYPMWEWSVILNHKDTDVRNITYQPWLQENRSTFHVEDTVTRTNVLEFTLQDSLTMITRILGPFQPVFAWYKPPYQRAREALGEDNKRQKRLPF